MITSLKKYMRLGAFAVLLTASVASCSDDYLLSPEPVGEGGDGYIVFRCADMLETFVGQHNPASRAGGSKNPEEKAINTLHIFFFDDVTGELLTREYDNFKPYQKVTSTSFIKIPTGDGVPDEFKEKMKKVRIVAIANIDATDEATSATDDVNQFYTDFSEGGKIQQAGREAGGTPYKIERYSDLEKWIYYPRIRMSEDGSGDISKLPEAGMPMIGELGNTKLGQDPLDLSEKPTTPTVVNMRALMAKVNVSVELDPDQSTEQYPLLKITGYGVRNMPIAVPFKQPTTEVRRNDDGTKKDSIKPTSYTDYFERFDVTNTPMFHADGSEGGGLHNECKPEMHEYVTSANVTINKDSEPVTFTYYTFENINLPDYNAMRAKPEYQEGDPTPAFNENLEPQYPSGVKDEDKQRWKSTFAYSDRASAMILKGEYTTHQGLTYKAQFTVYLGCTVGVEDPNIDFQVKRNHRYDNNIVIHGLEYIRNSSDDVYNFDGRVNVVDDNPFYLAIVNERKVDAHATALPMDVWFMLREDGNGNIDDVPWNSEITFTVRNHGTDDGNWIRMEKIPREMMAAGRKVIENGEEKIKPFYPGTGSRDYFTTDLVTATLKENGKIAAGLDQNWQITVPGELEHGWEITVDGDTDGSRSRIYFYIDENVPMSNDQGNYGDRTAIIDIIYTRKDNDGNVLDRRVRTLDIEQRALLKVEGQHKSGTVPTTWMEYYEEYLEHNDPLDQHEQPGEFYSGLEWGLNGTRIQASANDEDLTQAYQLYTKTGGFSMSRYVINNTSSLSAVTLFNNNPPVSAFHYCFGKNKRNSDGSAYYEYRQTTFWGVVIGNVAKGWYMPGIRELELGLVQYYSVFSNEFSNNLYWSAAPAEGSNNHARATGIIVDGNSYDYVESSSGKSGYVPRTGENSKKRIRAFYRVD